MIEKKLLTIAGILGILACGACFLPPITDRQPAPPQKLPPAKVRTVRVVVTDGSNPEHIDTQSIAALVAHWIDVRLTSQGISAHTGNEPADANLEIELNDEDAILVTTSPSDGTETWSFSFSLSTALVNNGGEIVRQKWNLPVRFNVVLAPNHPAGVWSLPEVRQACASQIEFAATRGIFF